MAGSDYHGFRSRRRPAARRSAWAGSVRLGVLFAVLVGINLYVFFFRGGTSIGDLMKTSAISKHAPGNPSAADTVVAPKKESAAGEHLDPNDDSILVKGDLRGHLGLSSALTERDIDHKQVMDLVDALKGVLDMRSLRPSQTFVVRLDPATKQIRTFRFAESPIRAVVAMRDASGTLRARRDDVELTVKRIKLGVRVNSSLGAALADAGEASSLISTVVTMFSWDINWYADTRDGDELRVIFEKKYNGRDFYRYGRVLAAEYRGRYGRHQAFYYKPRGAKSGGHYTPEGRSIRRDFLKTPLNFKRISSGFDRRRFHPVLHRTRGHFGVDYAADPGAFVWTVADGTVTKVGRYPGAGNKVVIQHKDGVVTEYMHLLRFARGIRRGVKVRQRQVIGYVGSTGLSTGPHLHYGMKINGKYVDPIKFRVGRGKLLPRAERARFRDTLHDRMAELEAIPVSADAEG